MRGEELLHLRVTRACPRSPEQRKKVTPVPHAVCSGLNFDETASDQIPLKIYEEHVNQPIKFFCCYLPFLASLFKVEKLLACKVLACSVTPGLMCDLCITCPR